MTLHKNDRGDFIGSVLPAHGFDSNLPDMDGLTRIAVCYLVCNLARGEMTITSDDVIKFIESYIPDLKDSRKMTIVNKMRAILNGCKVVKNGRMSFTFDIGEGNKNFAPAPEGSAKQYVVAEKSHLKKMKIIPEQLKEALFILLFPESKLPYGSSRMDDGTRVFYYAGYQEPARISWNDVKYQYTYAEMQSLLASSNYSSYNYAVVDKQFLVIDCDNFDLMNELCPEFQNLMNSTFTVKSGRDSSAGYHSYFICEDIPDFSRKKLALVDKESNEDLGDIRLRGNFFTVAPHSVHPDSGKEYTVSSDVPIRSIKWDEVSSILGPCIKEKHVPKKVVDAVTQQFEKAKRESIKYGNNPTSKLSITCHDVLMPVDAYFNGHDYIGAHPIHGSETGHNLAVSADGSQWFCFRDNCGGGLIQAIAVAYDIRDCGDLARSFTKEEWKQIDGIIEELDPEHYDAYKEAGLANYRERKRAEALSELGDLLASMPGAK